jgi:hypothetical protein
MGGYSIASGEAKDSFRRTTAFTPWIMSEVHEMVPYETGKEVMKGMLKARAEGMKR